MGITQDIQSCDNAHPPTNTAGPVLRAGFTDVVVTGILTIGNYSSPFSVYFIDFINNLEEDCKCF